jgi:putative DNA primase/helicase
MSRANFQVGHDKRAIYWNAILADLGFRDDGVSWGIGTLSSVPLPNGKCFDFEVGNDRDLEELIRIQAGTDNPEIMLGYIEQAQHELEYRRKLRGRAHSKSEADIAQGLEREGHRQKTFEMLERIELPGEDPPPKMSADWGESLERDSSRTPAAEGATLQFSKPIALKPIFNGIPAELQAIHNWVLWRYLPPKKPGGKWRKVPFQPNGQPADITERRTWSSFEACCTVYEQRQFDGIGFVFDGTVGPDGFCLTGIDFDKCIDNEEVTLFTRKTILKLNTYTELSVSRTGLHCIGYAPPSQRSVKKVGIEIYNRARYFTFTGHKVKQSQIRVITTEVRELIAETESPKKSTDGKLGPVDPAFAHLPVKSLSEGIESSGWFDRLTGELKDEVVDHALDVITRNTTFFELEDVAKGVGDNHTWYALTAAAARSGAPNAEDIFVKYASKAENPDPEDELRKYFAFCQKDPPSGREKFTVGTLLYIAQEHGADFEPWRERAQEEKGEAADKRGFSRNAVDTAPLHSEEGLALAFAERHAERLRYVAKRGQWLVWDGSCWRMDQTLQVFTLARELCREIATKVNKPSERKRIASAKTRAAVVSLAREDRRLAATSEQWDTDPWLLNTPDGVVDLHTGKLREHRITDYMTKQTAVSPTPASARASCPRWRKFLQEITDDDEELRRYLQRVAGYCLTGTTHEHQLWFCYGPGRNGKGVWIRTVSGILRDYHESASIETFTVSHSEKHPTELAKLVGARLITASETEEGRHWAEARIKKMTGGDPIDARFMRQDFFTYDPQFKLMFAGNNMPTLRGVNKAIAARFNRVPFTVIIADDKINKYLADELKAEWPSILQWAVEGCLEWQRIGLRPPKCVIDATESYLESEDILGEWIGECCIRDANAWESSADLFGSWNIWASLREEWVGSVKTFTAKLEDRGEFVRRKNKEKTKRGFSGLRLKIMGERAKERVKS